MIEVIFMACSLLSGQKCQEIRLTFSSETVSHFECMLYGQSAIAKWVSEHPNWSPNKGYKCGRPSHFAKA